MVTHLEGDGFCMMSEQEAEAMAKVRALEVRDKAVRLLQEESVRRREAGEAGDGFNSRYRRMRYFP